MKTSFADESIHEQAPDRATGDAGLSLDLMQMLEILDEEDRAMLILKYAENYNYEELSEIFGVSVSACKMRVSRACDKIQERFGEQTYRTTDGSGETPHWGHDVDRPVRKTGRSARAAGAGERSTAACTSGSTRGCWQASFSILACAGVGFALLHFAQRWCGLLKLTVTGKFESGPHDGSRPAP